MCLLVVEVEVVVAGETGMKRDQFRSIDTMIHQYILVEVVEVDVVAIRRDGSGQCYRHDEIEPTLSLTRR